LCPGRKVGAVDIFGFAVRRSGVTDFPVLGAFRWFVDCFCLAGAREMSAGRVINSNAKFFNTGTVAGGTWRRNVNLAGGDNVQAASGSDSEEL